MGHGLDVGHMSISVVISTYNRFPLLRETIRSVLAQTKKPSEVIVVDDASTQPEYALPWEKEYDGLVQTIRLSQNSRNLFGYASEGYVKSVGVNQARGEYIAICDDDDVWLPQKLELQLAAIASTGLLCCSTEAYYCSARWPVDAAGWSEAQLAQVFMRYNHEYFRPHHARVLHNDGSLPRIWNCALIKRHNFGVHSSYLYDRSLYDAVGGYPYKRIGSDRDLLLKLLKRSDMVYIHEPCLLYDGTPGRGLY